MVIVVMKSGHFYVTTDSPHTNDKGEVSGTLRFGGRLKVFREHVEAIENYMGSHDRFTSRVRELENRQK